MRQARRRKAEAAARLQVVEALDGLLGQGWSRQEAAEILAVPLRTLGQWRAQAREDNLQPTRLGRPLVRSAVEERNKLIAILCEQGPQVGVMSLWRLVPKLARGEVEDILRRFRQQYIRDHELLVQALQWTTPGAVWALDHTFPPTPIDGAHRAILSVRDLSSGAELLWQAQAGPQAKPTIEALEALFVKHGPPLVLKADNGSAFIAEEFQKLAQRWGVSLLWSPPGCPSYNGAVESGIRWMKERTEHQAWLRAEPQQWRIEDLQRARETQNQEPKDNQKGSMPRREVFENRADISPQARKAFEETIQRERALERQARNIPMDLQLTHWELADIDRQAIPRALVAHGFLTITERRVSLTLRSLFRAKIS